MNIHDFIGTYRNHPVIFVGTGISRRYLKNSYGWEELLEKASFDLTEDKKFFLDLKHECYSGNKYLFERIGSKLEDEFDKRLKNKRNGKLENINDSFYEYSQKNIHTSRFKVYIANILSDLQFRENMEDEINEFKKIRKNIGSVITTNYDCLIENIFEFEPLVGNDILLSNPYGSVYKIHGCVNHPDKIIITEQDYGTFNNKYELIRAQLLSLFIHNPIIFIGYSISDNNVKSILKTIFSYVDYNSELSEKIRNNFLLVEYVSNSSNLEVVEHDIDIENLPTIRINKIKTDNFIGIYQEISQLILPISAMDIRKVQNVVKDIYSGGEIRVNITESLDDLSNSDKILVIGSKKTIQYEFQTKSEMIKNYFNIIDEYNSQLVELINKQKIQKTEYFPIFGFYKLNNNILNYEELRKQQIDKLSEYTSNIQPYCNGTHCHIQDILEDDSIQKTYKEFEIIKCIMNKNIALQEVKDYLIKYVDKKSTSYRRCICAYDFMMYNN